MKKSRNQTCFIKKFSITLRTNKNTRAFLISTLASFLKRASDEGRESIMYDITLCELAE